MKKQKKIANNKMKSKKPVKNFFFFYKENKDYNGCSFYHLQR